MKLNLETIRKRKRSSRGRKQVLKSPKLFSLFIPDDERKDINELMDRGKKLKVPYASVAFILREGAKLYVREQQKLLNKAEAGEFHAKKRKQ